MVDRRSALNDRPGQPASTHGKPGSATADDIRRLAKALSGVKRRIDHPKLPEDACYAGVAYRLPEPPRAAAALLLEKLGPLPPGMSLDRIDPHGHYAIGNLRYATPKQQTENRRPLRKREVLYEEE
jgi:cation transport regulator ChaC